MCLSADPEENKKFVEKCNRKKKTWVWRYKVVQRREYSTPDVNLFGPIYSNYEYKPGINKSNARTKLNKHRTGIYDIYRGIHVFNTRGEAEDNWLMNRHENRIIKVRCLVEDFLGTDGYESVFKNVYISKGEYERCCST